MSYILDYFEICAHKILTLMQNDVEDFVCKAVGIPQILILLKILSKVVSLYKERWFLDENSIFSDF